MYHEPKIGADLNAGLEEFVKKEQNLGGVELIEEALIDAGIDLETDTTAKWIMYRNCLNRVMNTLYSDDAWVIDVHKDKDGRLRLQQVNVEQPDYAPPATMKRFAYYGYKFEQLCTDPQHPKATAKQDEFCGVFYVRIGKHKMFVGAEMDCYLKPPLQGSAPEFVELKTAVQSAVLSRGSNFARFKMRKYWIQSWLVGTAHIIVGLRDKHGILRQIKRYATKQLPRMGERYWSASACLNFLDHFLHVLDAKTEPGFSYTVQRPHGGQIRIVIEEKPV